MGNEPKKYDYATLMLMFNDTRARQIFNEIIDAKGKMTIDEFLKIVSDEMKPYEEDYQD